LIALLAFLVADSPEEVKTLAPYLIFKIVNQLYWQWKSS
jgi:hypothetical protein